VQLGQGCLRNGGGSSGLRDCVHISRPFDKYGSILEQIAVTRDFHDLDSTVNEDEAIANMPAAFCHWDTAALPAYSPEIPLQIQRGTATALKPLLRRMDLDNGLHSAFVSR
jgi:hypothetical protein